MMAVYAVHIKICVFNQKMVLWDYVKVNTLFLYTQDRANSLSNQIERIITKHREFLFIKCFIILYYPISL